MSKGISQFIALLIVIGIVIGGALVASYIVGGLITAQKPKGSDLAGKLFWLWEKAQSGGYIIYVHGPVCNVGSDIVNVTAVEISYAGNKYPAEFTPMELHLSECNEILAKAVVGSLPPTSTITAIIHFCTSTGCTASTVPAVVRSTEYLSSYEVVTVTMPVTVTQTITATVPAGATVTQTQTATVTRTATVTVTAAITQTATVTTTTTATRTTTVTTTATTTATMTTTTTMTTTITKPAWIVWFTACYTVDNYIIVTGTLDKPVSSDAEYIPYAVKYFRCDLFICREIGIKPFTWWSAYRIGSSYGPVGAPLLGYFKVEVWIADPNSGQLVQKIWESDVDTSRRCA